MKDETIYHVAARKPSVFRYQPLDAAGRECAGRIKTGDQSLVIARLQKPMMSLPVVFLPEIPVFSN